MPRHAQRTFDGMAVTKPKARFTGTFELEDTEYDSCPLDNTVVCVVVAKIGDLNIKVTDTEVEATRVLKISEMRMLPDGDMKTQLVEQLGLYGFDTLPLDVPTKAPDAARVVDNDTGEIVTDDVDRPAPDGPKSVPFTLDDTDEDPGPLDSEVVGSIYDGLHQDPRVAAFAQETSRA